MKLVYHEVDSKDNSNDTGTPCAGVRVFIPDGEDEYELPALIGLSAGRLNDLGDARFYDTKWYMLTFKNQAKTIRAGIILFDQYKAEMFKPPVQEAPTPDAQTDEPPMPEKDGD